MIVSCVPIEKHSTVDPYRHEISGPGRNAIQYTIIACFPPLALRFLALDGGDDRDLFLKLSDLEYYSVTTVKNCITKIKNSNTLYLPEKTRVFFYHVSVRCHFASPNQQGPRPYAPANVTCWASCESSGQAPATAKSPSPRRPC